MNQGCFPVLVVRRLSFCFCEQRPRTLAPVPLGFQSRSSPAPLKARASPCRGLRVPPSGTCGDTQQQAPFTHFFPKLDLKPQSRFKLKSKKPLLQKLSLFLRSTLGGDAARNNKIPLRAFLWNLQIWETHFQDWVLDRAGGSTRCLGFWIVKQQQPQQNQKQNNKG